MVMRPLASFSTVITLLTICSTLSFTFACAPKSKKAVAVPAKDPAAGAADQSIQNRDETQTGGIIPVGSGEPLATVDSTPYGTEEDLYADPSLSGNINPTTGLPMAEAIDPDTGLPVAGGAITPATGLPMEVGTTLPTAGAIGANTALSSLFSGAASGSLNPQALIAVTNTLTNPSVTTAGSGGMSILSILGPLLQNGIQQVGSSAPRMPDDSYSDDSYSGDYSDYEE